MKKEILVKGILSEINKVLPIKERYELRQHGENVSITFDESLQSKICKYLWDNLDIEITKENINLYYEHMSVSDKYNFRDIIHYSFNVRTPLGIEDYLKIDNKEIAKFWEYECFQNGRIKSQSIFGIEDNLKPIDEFIEDIKNSEKYKLYQITQKYNLDAQSQSLKKLEYELFADDNTYQSNTENLIYTTLDYVADEFKMNVIEYIESNNLQDKTGISCISDIVVIIENGEFQGIFKEFESYGLQDFSIQNITMFIDRYKEYISVENENNLSIVDAEYETGLDFYEIQEYIPNITIDNDVVNDGYIVRFSLELNNEEQINIFYDEKTGEYAYSLENTQSEYQSQYAEILDELGQEIQKCGSDYQNLYDNLSDKLTSVDVQGKNLDTHPVDIIAEAKKVTDQQTTKTY